MEEVNPTSLGKVNKRKVLNSSPAHLKTAIQGARPVMVLGPSPSVGGGSGGPAVSLWCNISGSSARPVVQPADGAVAPRVGNIAPKASFEEERGVPRGAGGFDNSPMADLGAAIEKGRSSMSHERRFYNRPGGRHGKSCRVAV